MGNPSKHKYAQNAMLFRVEHVDFLSYEGGFEQSSVARLLPMDASEQNGLGFLKFGFMRLNSDDMRRQRPYDMVFVLLEGNFRAVLNHETLEAATVGDVIWIPRETSVILQGNSALVWYAAAKRFASGSSDESLDSP